MRKAHRRSLGSIALAPFVRVEFTGTRLPRCQYNNAPVPNHSKTKRIPNITVTLHGRHGVSNRQWVDLFVKLFLRAINKKLRRTAKSTGNPVDFPHKGTVIRNYVILNRVPISWYQLYLLTFHWAQRSPFFNDQLGISTYSFILNIAHWTKWTIFCERYFQINCINCFQFDSEYMEMSF